MFQAILKQSCKISEARQILPFISRLSLNTYTVLYYNSLYTAQTANNLLLE